MSKTSRLKRAHRKKLLKKVHPTRPLGSGKLLRRMSRGYRDVLQNIEFVLVTEWRDIPRADDADVEKALLGALNGEARGDARVHRMVDGLSEMRAFRSDIVEPTWRDCLRTVLQSVRRHSSRRPGERSYLHFAAAFIP